MSRRKPPNHLASRRTDHFLMSRKLWMHICINFLSFPRRLDKISALDALPPLLDWHQYNYTTLYFHLSYITWHFVFWLRPSAIFLAEPPCVHRRTSFWYYATLHSVHPFHIQSINLVYLSFLSCFAHYPPQNYWLNWTQANKMFLGITTVQEDNWLSYFLRTGPPLSNIPLTMICFYYVTALTEPFKTCGNTMASHIIIKSIPVTGF